MPSPNFSQATRIRGHALSVSWRALTWSDLNKLMAKSIEYRSQKTLASYRCALWCRRCPLCQERKIEVWIENQSWTFFCTATSVGWAVPGRNTVNTVHSKNAWPNHKWSPWIVPTCGSMRRGPDAFTCFAQIHLFNLWKSWKSICNHSIYSKLNRIFKKKHCTTLPETTMTPENGPSQMESSIPTIHFQVLC